MFVLLVAVVVGAGFVWPVCCEQKCTCNTDSTICTPDDGENDCKNCRDLYKLKAGNNFTCVLRCPDGRYREDSPYHQCVRCSDIYSHCDKCHKPSNKVECTECEHGYVVVVNGCKNETASGQSVCPLYTCMLPVIGGGVAVILVVVCVWVVCRRRARRSTRPPPAREDIGVMATQDPEANRNRQLSPGFDPPTQSMWETETSVQRQHQADGLTGGSTSTENSKKKRIKKHKRGHHKGRRHHSDKTEDRVRSRERETRRTGHHTTHREGNDEPKRSSIISEGMMLYHALKRKGGRDQHHLPPVPPEGGQSYENEDVINQLHKAGPMTSSGSGATSGRPSDTGDTKPSNSHGRPDENTPGDIAPHDYENEDVIKTLHKSKAMTREGGAVNGGQHLGGISASGVAASGGAAATSDSVGGAKVSRSLTSPEEGQLDEERRDYVNAEVIGTLQKLEPKGHDYENKDAIEKLKQSKEKQDKHNYVNVDPTKTNRGKR